MRGPIWYTEKNERGGPDEAADLLAEIERISLFATLEKGIFADIKRPQDGGKGLSGVVRKSDRYFNPFIEAMKEEKR